MNQKLKIPIIIMLLLVIGGLAIVIVSRQNQGGIQENVDHGTVEKTGSEVIQNSDAKEAEGPQAVSETEEEKHSEAIRVEEDGEIEIIIPEGQESGGF